MEAASVRLYFTVVLYDDVADWEFHDAGGFVPSIFRFELIPDEARMRYGQRRYYCNTIYKLCYHTLTSLLGDEEHGLVICITSAFLCSQHCLFCRSSTYYSDC